MMGRYLTLLLFICITSNCLSQIHEIGFFVGGVNYVGDVGRTNYIHPNDTGVSFLYKYNINPRMAIRGNYSNFSISLTISFVAFNFACFKMFLDKSS